MPVLVEQISMVAAPPGGGKAAPGGGAAFAGILGQVSGAAPARDDLPNDSDAPPARDFAQAGPQAGVASRPPNRPMAASFAVSAKGPAGSGKTPAARLPAPPGADGRTGTGKPAAGKTQVQKPAGSGATSAHHTAPASGSSAAAVAAADLQQPQSVPKACAAGGDALGNDGAVNTTCAGRAPSGTDAAAAEAVATAEQGVASGGLPALGLAGSQALDPNSQAAGRVDAAADGKPAVPGAPGAVQQFSRGEGAGGAAPGSMPTTDGKPADAGLADHFAGALSPLASGDESARAINVQGMAGSMAGATEAPVGKGAVRASPAAADAAPILASGPRSLLEAQLDEAVPGLNGSPGSSAEAISVRGSISAAVQLLSPLPVGIGRGAAPDRGATGGPETGLQDADTGPAQISPDGGPAAGQVPGQAAASSASDAPTALLGEGAALADRQGVPEAAPSGAAQATDEPGLPTSSGPMPAGMPQPSSPVAAQLPGHEAASPTPSQSLAAARPGAGASSTPTRLQAGLAAPGPQAAATPRGLPLAEAGRAGGPKQASATVARSVGQPMLAASQTRPRSGAAESYGTAQDATDSLDASSGPAPARPLQQAPPEQAAPQPGGAAVSRKDTDKLDGAAPAIASPAPMAAKPAAAPESAGQPADSGPQAQAASSGSYAAGTAAADAGSPAGLSPETAAPGPTAAAPAQAANQGAAVQQPTAPATPQAQLAQAAASLHLGANGSGNVTIRLAPAELGQLQIRIAHGQGGASVQIVAERPETLAALQTDLGHLHQALDRAGVAGARTVSFELAPSGDQAGAQGQGTSSGGFAQDSQQNARQDHRQHAAPTAAYAATAPTDIGAGSLAPKASAATNASGVNITA